MVDMFILIGGYKPTNITGACTTLYGHSEPPVSYSHWPLAYAPKSPSMIERGVTLDDKDTKKNAKTEVRHPNSGDTLKVN